MRAASEGIRGAMEQENIGRGATVAVIVAAVCVLPYAYIVKAAHANFSYLSIGVGIAVALAARKIGQSSGIVTGVVAAVATFAASLLADVLAIKWIVAEKLGFDISLLDARRGVRPLSYLIFAIGAFVAFRVAGGMSALQQRSASSGAGRFTPDSMTGSASYPAPGYAQQPGAQPPYQPSGAQPAHQQPSAQPAYQQPTAQSPTWPTAPAVQTSPPVETAPPA